MSLTNGSHLSCGPSAEGSSKEPGDEGSNGSDEEPAVGRQCHADAQEFFTESILFVREEFLHMCTD